MQIDRGRLFVPDGNAVVEIKKHKKKMRSQYSAHLFYDSQFLGEHHIANVFVVKNWIIG